VDRGGGRDQSGTDRIFAEGSVLEKQEPRAKKGDAAGQAKYGGNTVEIDRASSVK